MSSVFSLFNLNTFALIQVLISAKQASNFFEMSDQWIVMF